MHGGFPSRCISHISCLQMANNYDEDVYNGDLGIVKSVEEKERRVEVWMTRFPLSGDH